MTNPSNPDMKSLRQTFSDNRRKAHGAIRSWLRPKMGAIGTRYRLAARIRKANSWATRHPRRTFGYVVGSLLMILLCDIIVTGARMESQEPELQSIAKVEPIFSGFRTIQANKEAQRRRLMEITATVRRSSMNLTPLSQFHARAMPTQSA